MPVTALVTAFVPPEEEFDQYEGHPALRVSGVSAIVEKDDTDYGFSNPTPYDVGGITIRVGEEYQNLRTVNPGNTQTSIPMVRVDSDSDLLIIGDMDNGYIWVLAEAESS